MFKFFARLAVTKPVLTSMLVAVFVFMGAFSYLSIPLDLFPGVDLPFVTVTTIYPGAGPEEVETEITEPIEDAVSTIANLESLISFSQENVSTVIVEFDYDVDGDLAAIEVKDKVDAIRAMLPSDAEAPTILKLDINAMPIMDVTISGPQALEALTDFADDVVRERLARVSGVASVTMTGGREREVQVVVLPDRLRAYGLSITEVAAMVGGENITVPAGRVTESDAEFSIRVVGEYRSLTDLENLPLRLSEGRIRLAEVATVREGFADQREIARYNGQPTLSLSIAKQSDANTVATAAGVFAAVDELRAQLPAGATMEIARDASEFIRDAVQDIFKNILIGIVLTTLVLFLFLHSWRGTVVAAVAMPATIVATFLAIDQAGFTINIMTLMALGITVGILVTNTIVVLESVYRHLDEGKDPKEAAEVGTTEVAIAVAASALTNVVVFTPIAFMEGIIGQFFVQFGMTVVFATLFSVLISFTLTPLLASKLLRTHETEREESEGRLAGFWRAFDRGYASLERDYRSALEWVLAKPSHGWAVFGGTGIFLVLAMFVQVAFVGGEFMPEQDEGLALITLEFPPGTPPARTSAAALRAEELLSDIPEVTSTLTQIGGQTRAFRGGSVGEANVAQVQVTLESELPTRDLFPAIREAMAQIPDADVTTTLTQSSGPGGGEAPLQILIKGPERTRLDSLAQAATATVAAVPGLTDVRNSIEDPRTEIAFYPDREVLTDYGLTIFAVGGTLRASIEGIVPGVYREAGDERDIRVRLTEESRNRVDELGSMQVRSSNGMVPISSLGRVEEQGGETAIQRNEKQRTVQIDAFIASGNLAALAEGIQLGLDEMNFPPGYSYQITGDFEMFAESMAEMLKALVIAIVLTYIVLAMILESYVHPITIMLTLPLGFVGAVFSLFLARSSLNIFSMMAIIMLVGIVVNNAILILDYTHQLREKGKGAIEALLEAAPIRLRPILMTNVAIAIALLPQATGSGAGSFYRIPMAVVTIGGVLVAAVFTLFLIPVIYAKLDRFSAASIRQRRGDTGEHPVPAADSVPQEG